MVLGREHSYKKSAVFKYCVNAFCRVSASKSLTIMNCSFLALLTNEEKRDCGEDILNTLRTAERPRNTEVAKICNWRTREVCDFETVGII